MRRITFGLAFGIVAVTWGPPSSATAEVLITEAEAKLPPSSNVPMATRGLTRGPGIEQASPRAGQAVKSPLPFRIKFSIRNGIPIDPVSVKLTYLKATPVDLTERIKAHLRPDGIDMDRAEVPSGTHVLRFDLKDQQGRVGTAIIKLIVKGK
jgi:hypothetical protein